VEASKKLGMKKKKGEEYRSPRFPRREKNKKEKGREGKQWATGKLCLRAAALRGYPE
jgi:hypothetical protein